MNLLKIIYELKELPEDYNELISLAQNDKFKEVRDMAQWVYQVKLDSGEV